MCNQFRINFAAAQIPPHTHTHLRTRSHINRQGNFNKPNGKLNGFRSINIHCYYNILRDGQQFVFELHPAPSTLLLLLPSLHAALTSISPMSIDIRVYFE